MPMAQQQLSKALVHSYVDRKDRKREFRQLWIIRINAAVREAGLSYSRFMIAQLESSLGKRGGAK